MKFKIVLFALLLAGCNSTYERGAWIDPSLCQNPIPNPPGMYHNGIYHDKLLPNGKPVCPQNGIIKF